MDEYVKPSQAAKHFGVSVTTLRRWEKDGIISTIRTKEDTGQRRYSIQSFKGITTSSSATTRTETVIRTDPEKEKFLYCRVSSYKQKDDLSRQEQYLKSLYPTYSVVKDIGSGLNYKRKGLLSLIKNASKGLVSEVIVAHKDRLCRYGFELIECIFSLYDVKLIVLQESELSPDQELSKDLLDIIHVFACRANGKRKYTKSDKNKQEVEQSEESDQDNET